MYPDVHYELRCLSKWIVAMENKVEPVNFRKKWSLSQLKQKAKEHEVRIFNILNYFDYKI